MLTSGARLSVLLLCDDSPTHAATVLDHIDALSTLSAHRVSRFNPLGRDRSRVLRLDDFDAVVIHYSLVCCRDWYLAPWFRERIRAFRGLKVQFIQDEYRWIDEVTATIRAMDVHVLYSCLPEAEIERVYGPRLPGVRVRTALTGYVPESLGRRAVPALRDRPLDVVYRGRDLPYWLGRLGQEKRWIGQGVLARAPAHGLRCDIAWREEDRVYGEGWIDLLTSARATLGTGSGASIADYDGSLERRVGEYLADHPGAGFEEVSDALLADNEGSLVLDVISPRLFEAAALRTALVLFPGPYSGVVQPWEHYLPLQRDFSNFDQVAARLRDVPFLEAMTGRAHHDLVASGRYSSHVLAAALDHELEQHATRRPHPPPVRLWLASLEPRPPARGRVARPTWPEVRAAIQIALLALLVVLGRRPLRSLAWRALQPGRGRPPLRRVLVDLLCLDILARAQRESWTAGDYFQADVEADGDGGIRLRSAPWSGWGQRPGTLSWRQVATALDARPRLTWDHSAIRQHVSHTLLRRDHWVFLSLSHGCRTLDGLAWLWARSPDLVRPALEPVTSAGVPCHPRRDPLGTGWSEWGLLLRGRPAIARLARRTRPGSRLARELYRLELLRRTRLAIGPGAWSCRFDSRSGWLILRPGGAGGEQAASLVGARRACLAGDLRAVVWEDPGDDGTTIYLTAFAAVARRRRPSAWRALAEVLVETPPAPRRTTWKEAAGELGLALRCLVDGPATRRALLLARLRGEPARPLARDLLLLRRAVAEGGRDLVDESGGGQLAVPVEGLLAWRRDGRPRYELLPLALGRRLTVDLGQGAEYRFEALGAAASLLSEPVRRALLRPTAVR